MIAPPNVEPETLRALHRLASSLPDAQADTVHAVAAIARELGEAARELHIMADASPELRESARDRVREALRQFYEGGP